MGCIIPTLGRRLTKWETALVKTADLLQPCQKPASCDAKVGLFLTNTTKPWLPTLRHEHFVGSCPF